MGRAPLKKSERPWFCKGTTFNPTPEESSPSLAKSSRKAAFKIASISEGSIFDKETMRCSCRMLSDCKNS
ncbi:Uncharacterised protein [Chlamydia trachomatis]|nr:Uncharacterised protein [Chlamydia trachomatis]